MDFLFLNTSFVFDGGLEDNSDRIHVTAKMYVVRSCWIAVLQFADAMADGKVKNYEQHQLITFRAFVQVMRSK